MDAVKRYLTEENALLIDIMLMMYLNGGQAPRTTEFFGIEWNNSPSSPRGVYIDDVSVLCFIKELVKSVCPCVLAHFRMMMKLISLPSPPRFHPFALSWVSYHTKAKAKAKAKRDNEAALTVGLE
jgi:hypothetical protein